MTWLVAGLGNPGDTYARTRHNVGRMVAVELARAENARLKKVRFLPAEAAEIHEGGERVLLVVSTLYMNESGPSYAGIAKKHGVDPAHVIAVHDELEVKPGELRVRFGGGSAGHNGLKSMANALRTFDFLRVRMGIGRPPGRQDPADFVLAPIPKKDEPDVAILVELACDAVRSLIRDGLAVTQERYNGSAPGQRP